MSSPWRLNSVLLTLRVVRLRSLESATTTQNLELVKAVRATLSSRRLLSVQSPRQPIRSLTATWLRPVASSSVSLCERRTRRPLVVTLVAFLMRTLCSRVLRESKSVRMLSLRSPRALSVSSTCWDTSLWKKTSGSLNEYRSVWSSGLV
uniref:Putative secreted protein n=1 Tax=Ixodes ricinus TaxID=34613 RepID=A0A6B0UV80_IXORI